MDGKVVARSMLASKYLGVLHPVNQYTYIRVHADESGVITTTATIRSCMQVQDLDTVVSDEE